jgi:hypothetical protein
MTFKAYMDNIEAKTGISLKQFRALADARGLTEKGRLKPGIRAGQVTDWLKADYSLGHGHAMALYALFKGFKQEGDA